MIRFVIRLAEVAVGISACYPETRRLCAEYCCQASPAFSVEITPEDIESERRISAREAALEGRPVPDYPASQLESTALLRKIAARLPAYDAWVFHGSAVAIDGKAYLFTAKSGTGKSTHVRLWRQQFGERAVVINDDKPILRIDGTGGVWVYGAPWNGKHRLGTNTAAILQGLAELRRGAENRIARIPAAQVWPMLLQQSYRPPSAEALRQTMRLLGRLAAAVPIYRLTCNMEQQAARVAYAEMRPKEKGSSDETEC